MYLGKYGLNFDGTLGDYIRIIRKTKKINSVDLSKLVGKSGAYISQIESGKNKNPDYSTLYEIFKRLGINEEKIDDYLYHFGVKSPEFEAWEEEQMLARMNPTKEDLEHMAEEAEYYREIEEQEMLDEENRRCFLDQEPSHLDNGEDLISDMFDEYMKKINDVLNEIPDYELIFGLGNSFSDMTVNVTLYKFMVKFFSERLTLLDNEGLTKVLNTLYEEVNRINREKTAFGKPIQRPLIDKL